MRYGPLVAVLAISATAVSGCQTTTPDIETTAAGGTGTTGTTGTGTPPATGTGTPAGTASDTDTGTGEGTVSTSTSTFSPGTIQNSGTGAPGPTVLSEGEAAMAFNSVGQSPNNGALVAITDVGTERRVAVDDRTAGALGWPEPITLPVYPSGTANGNLRGTHSLLAGASAGANYEEYRRIDGSADAELQLWNYDYSRIGQYRVYTGGNSTDPLNLAVFHSGQNTDPADLPATATYVGRMGATATAANWIEFERTVADRDAAVPETTFDQGFARNPDGSVATDAAGNPIVIDVGAIVDQNGEWRVTGDSRLTADFGAGTVTGTFNNLAWKRFEPNPAERTDGNGYITVFPDDEPRSGFPRAYNIDGTITEGDFAGTVSAGGSFVDGNTSASGSFYGPNGEEAAGVFFNEATGPGPIDGQSPYEQQRRAYVNIRGVFQGNR